MFDLDLLIQATKDGLGIAVAAFPFLKEILPKKGDELSQAIEETRRATIETAQTIDANIREIRHILDECNLNINMSLNQLNREVGIFTDGVCYIRTKTIRKKLKRVEQNLIDLIDDLPPLLLCRGQFDQLKAASQSASSRKQEIDENFSYQRPVGELLNYMAMVAARIIGELGGDFSISGGPLSGPPGIGPTLPSTGPAITNPITG